eukprot:6901075-Karenia_brevis.AAC.1
MHRQALSPHVMSFSAAIYVCKRANSVEGAGLRQALGGKLFALRDQLQCSHLSSQGGFVA